MKCVGNPHDNNRQNVDIGIFSIFKRIHLQPDIKNKVGGNVIDKKGLKLKK